MWEFIFLQTGYLGRSSRFLKGLLVVSVLLCGHEAAGNNSEISEPIIFGVSPWTHEDLLFNWAKPIVKHIEANSSAQVRIRSAKNLKEYYQRGKNGEFDAFISPIHMGLDLVKHDEFIPLMWLRVGYKVMIVCDKSLGYTNLKHIENQRVVLPSMYATTALLLLLDLKSAGVEVKSELLKDQWKVLEQLHSGRAKCGGVLSKFYQAQSDVFKSRFNMVYRNPLTLDALVIAPPSTPPKKQSAILNLVNGFHDQGSIVQGFDLVGPEDIPKWNVTLEPLLKAFRQDVLKQ